MQRFFNGNQIFSIKGALRRTGYAIEKPSFADLFSKLHPQHQALSILEWMASEQNDRIVPYRRLDTEILMPIHGSWALFQLFEAIQLYRAWQWEETPNTIDGQFVADVFSAVGHPDQKTPFFPDGNISPMARLALLKIPALLPRIDWAVRLTMQQNGGSFATLSKQDLKQIQITLPNEIVYNSYAKIWELRS